MESLNVAKKWSSEKGRNNWSPQRGRKEMESFNRANKNKTHPKGGEIMEPIIRANTLEPQKRAKIEQMESTKWKKYQMIHKNGSEMTRKSREKEKQNKQGNPQRNHKKRRRGKQTETKQTLKEKGIKVIYANANGIGDKAASVESTAKAEDAQVIAITETKQIPPKLDGYMKWYSKERKGQQGGGVAITVRNDLAKNVNRISEFDNDDIEIVWIEVTISNVNKLYIGTYYGKQEKAPTEEVENEMSELCSQIEFLKAKGQILLTGDFNAKLLIQKQNILQTESRNGRILKQVIDFTKIEPVSLRADNTWTRVNRNKTDEKSVIDYVFTSQELAEKIKHIHIDEEGTHRIKGKKESDHNTIITELTLDIEPQTKKITKYRMGNMEGWKKYKQEIPVKLREVQNPTPEKITQVIQATLKETVGQVTITIGRKKKPKESQRTKDLREKRKESKKEYEKAIKERDKIKEKLDDYTKAQKELRAQIEKDQVEEAKRNVERMRNKFRIRSTEFWKFRAECEGRGQKEEYDTVDEDGHLISDPQEAKEHIASFYENLYTARESDEKYEEETKRIKEEVSKISRDMKDKEPIPEIQKEEITRNIKKLKRNKASGPDNIPNEALIELDSEAKEIIREAFNNTNQRQSMPEQWQDGTLHRLYKGKGKKGKCSNERGITVASNLGKLYERVINDRVTERAKISLAQAGGRKGSSTVDHILLLQEAIKSARKNKENVYVIFMDVTKAFDKAWLEGIMHILYQNGLTDSHWEIVKRLNENLKATIITKHGPTRKIDIHDSIRQGGVLSVVMFGIMMDQISKEIADEDIGIVIEGTNLKISSLLWVDDLVLVETDPERMKKALNIVEKVAGKYHIKFGEQKSKTIEIGKQKTRPLFKLEEMNLMYESKYKYLGYLQSEKNSIDEHLKSLKGKVEAAYQKTISLATNPTLKWVEMDAIWTTVETCLVPIITYAGETMEFTNRKQKEEINRLLEAIIRRILMVPNGTPKEALYVETGLVEPTTLIEQQRINLHARLKNGNNTWMKEIVKENRTEGWIKETRETERKMGIEEDDLTGKKEQIKKRIQDKVDKHFKQKIDSAKMVSEGKTKTKYLLTNKVMWKPRKGPPYMSAMSRKEASTIFKARTCMIKVKMNYKNKFKNNLKCRMCKEENETQQHVMENCKMLHTEEETKVFIQDIFNEDITHLKTTVKKIDNILEKIDQAQVPVANHYRIPP